MRNLFRAISIFVILLSVSSCLPGQKRPGGKVSGSRSGKVDFTPIIEFHGSAFPVQILSTASTKTNLNGSARMIDKGGYIGDTLGNFGAKITGVSKGDKIKLEVESSRFIEKSPLSRTIKSGGRTYEVFPAIKYRYDELRKLRQPREENVSFKLYVNGKLKKEAVKTVDFRSLTEVPFMELSRRDKRSVVDHSYMFAAMVNEDAPFIDSVILKEAIQSGAIGYFSGSRNSNSFSDYQSGSENEVLAQVFSIWYVLQNHKLRYSNIVTTSNESNKVISQNVRSVEESFKNTQANCVDGSVLFASVMRKIGIDSFLVLVPGHMFVGFYAARGAGKPYYLETTMIGSTDITSFQGNERLSVSRRAFMNALDSGRQTFSGTNVNNRNIVDIAKCRTAGIKPVHR
jgi:predicted DNA-binding protein (UPF0251 family)